MLGYCFRKIILFGQTILVEGTYIRECNRLWKCAFKFDNTLFWITLVFIIKLSAFEQGVHGSSPGLVDTISEIGNFGLKTLIWMK